RGRGTGPDRDPQPGRGRPRPRRPPAPHTGRAAGRRDRGGGPCGGGDRRRAGLACGRRSVPGPRAAGGIARRAARSAVVTALVLMTGAVVLWPDTRARRRL